MALGSKRRAKEPNNQPGYNPPDNRRLPDYIDLAEAYVPIQQFGNMFNLQEALEKGSLWPALYRPYTCPYKKNGGGC